MVAEISAGAGGWGAFLLPTDAEIGAALSAARAASESVPDLTALAADGRVAADADAAAAPDLVVSLVAEARVAVDSYSFGVAVQVGFYGFLGLGI